PHLTPPPPPSFPSTTLFRSLGSFQRSLAKGRNSDLASQRAASQTIGRIEPSAVRLDCRDTLLVRQLVDVPLPERLHDDEVTAGTYRKRTRLNSSNTLIEYAI